MIVDARCRLSSEIERAPLHQRRGRRRIATLLSEPLNFDLLVPIPPRIGNISTPRNRLP